jgi:hypothetical protein
MLSRRTATGCRGREGELGVARFMVEVFVAACFRKPRHNYLIYSRSWCFFQAQYEPYSA